MLVPCFEIKSPKGARKNTIRVRTRVVTLIKLFMQKLSCDDEVLLFQAQIGEISVKRIRATSAYEQQGEKLTLQLAWLTGKELVTVLTVPRYQDLLQLENRTALKLGIQQCNLQFVEINHTGMCIQNVNHTSM